MLVTVHIYMLFAFVGNNSQDCSGKQTNKMNWRQWNEGNCKLCHKVEKHQRLSLTEGKLELTASLFPLLPLMYSIK